MPSVVNFAEYLKNVIQAGQSIEGNVVRVIADNGDEIGDVVFKVINGGNGVSNEVGVTVQTGVTGATTTGLAFMAVDVGVAGAAIAPALGVLAGVGLYNLAPEFWTNVSNALVNAGQTIGGKIIAFWDGDNVNFSKETIEIFKSALIDTGIFEQTYDPELSNDGITTQWKTFNNFVSVGSSNDRNRFNALANDFMTYASSFGFADLITNDPIPASEITEKLSSAISDILALQPLSSTYNTILYISGSNDSGSTSGNTIRTFQVMRVCTSAEQQIHFGSRTLDGVHKIYGLNNALLIDVVSFYKIRGTWYYYVYPARPLNYFNDGAYVEDEYNTNPITNGVTHFIHHKNASSQIPIIVSIDLGLGELTPNPNAQPDATYPDGRPISNIYPNWLPWEYPVTVPDPSALPTVYPTKYPETEPDPYPTQDPAQNPDPEPYPVIIPVINPDFPLPQPNPDPTPEPEPTPDPDPQPDPDPIPEPETPEPTPDPTNPNPDPTPSPVVPIVPLPDTVASNRLFTVYNPSASELNDLGAYLWDSSIIASIRDIWQNPLDGVISLIQVYATPPTSGRHNIILGFLDSGVGANVVSNQFITIDCGSVTIPENKFNATDYAPYTSLHLYLPFIGIVELDTNECMNSTINVKYKIDVYTGTCLATVSVTRAEDMPNAPILYTYSGNCSQQIPLTSGNATGMLTALIGGITAGLSVASGGGFGLMAGAQIATQTLTREMFHVSHSGNISANAGIMGQKKPYLIIGRRHGYDANNYSALYGFPANKTIVLGNHTGYVKVKHCFLKTTATQPEHDEIMSLLRNGVIL